MTYGKKNKIECKKSIFIICNSLLS